MAQTNFGLGMADEARAVAAELDRTYPDYLPGKLMQLQLALFGADANGQRAAINLANDLLTRLSKIAPDRENSPQVLGEIQEKTSRTRHRANALEELPRSPPGLRDGTADRSERSGRLQQSGCPCVGEKQTGRSARSV